MDIVNLFLNSQPELSNIIGKFIYWLYNGIGNFGWAIIVFSLILKTITFPLDFWQKSLMRKNNKIMNRMKPQLEKIQKQCNGDKMLYNQKSMELYKKEGYSTFGACLPSIVTMVMFIIVFGGVRASVTYHNELIVFNLTETYNTMKDEGKPQEEIDNALYTQYVKGIDSWLWIKNVFMPDTHADVVPDYATYSGTGMGKLAAKIPENMVDVTYDELLAPVAKMYNKEKWNDIGKWNGYFLLPILSILLSFVTTKTMKQSTPPTMSSNPQQQDSQKNTMKIMQYTMPLFIGVFSLFYSSALSIYFFMSQLISAVFQVTYNLITDKIDKEEEIELNNGKTYRR